MDLNNDPFVPQKNSCHPQLLSSCVAHRLKHLTMLLCVMLCRRSVFGVTNLKKLFFCPQWTLLDEWTEDRLSVTHTMCFSEDLSVDSTKVKCWNLACEFARKSKICKEEKQKQKVTFNISDIAIIFLPVFWHAVLMFAFIYSHPSSCLWWTVPFLTWTTLIHVRLIKAKSCVLILNPDAIQEF